MRKLKLLLASVALLFGGGISVNAQTDVTSTYLTNADFEGDSQLFLKINSDGRGVQKPTGWSVEWTQGKSTGHNGMTYVGSMNQDNKNWTAHGGEKAYFTRMRWENSTLNLRQTMINLPQGSYTLSFYATAYSSTSGATGGTASVSVAGQSQTITVGSNVDANWTQYTLNFTITESTPYATIEVTAARTADNFKFGIDDFTLTYDGSSYYSTILLAAQSLYNDNKDWAENGLEDLNTAITNATGKETIADKNSAIFALEEAMATFKAANSTDMTSRITNATFDSNIDGWTTTGGDGNAYQRQTSSQNNFNGGFLEKWRNGWNGGYNQKNFDVYQTLSSLPNGEYTIKAAIIAVMQGSCENQYNDKNNNEWTYSNKKHGGPYYIDDEKGVWLYGTSGENSGKAWANTRNSEFDGNGAEYKTATVKVKNGSLTIGFKGIGSENGGTSLGTYANWIACDNWTLSYFGFDPTALLAEITTLQENATSLLTNDDYVNVVGTERTALRTASTLVPADNKKATLMAAISQIETAISDFTSAKTNYDALVAEIAYAKTIGIATATTDSYVATSESTAATALASTQALKVAEYTHITTSYTESATLGAWTEDFAEDPKNEGYVADGDTYWNEWGTNTRTGKQTVTLPAGDYAISCIARGAVGTSGYLYYKIGDADAVTTNFLMKGNRGKGVDTSGAANFGDGTYTCDNNGFGWEYRFLTFTLAEESEVELGVSATFAGNWVSIYAPVLLTTEATVKNLRLAEIAAALNLVPSGNMNKTVQSTLDSKVAAAEAATMSNTKEELATILSELNDAISAANTSKAEYTKISDYLTAAKASFDGDYSAIEDAIADGDYTDSTDGMAAVKARRGVVATTGMTAGKDLTGLIDNNSFETGNTNFWTVGASSDTGARDANNATYSMSNSAGNWVFNTWWQGIPITQNVGNLPAGAYELKGVVASDGGTVYITMNDKHEAFVETAGKKDGDSFEPKTVGIEFSYVFTLDAEQEVTIGIVGGADGTEGAHKDYSAAGYWFYKADNFRLKYLGSTIPENTIDGTWYLSTGGNKLNRGGDSGTEGVMADEGIPVVITTDKAGISTLKFKDTDKYLFYSTSEVYTDGTIDPAKTHHKPYWKLIAVEGGYNILNTQSGLYLNTTTATRNEVEMTVVTCTEEAAVWTLSDALLPAARIELAAAIASAPATPTQNIGSAAFQISQAQVDALTSAVSAAQDVYDNAEATLSQVQTATTTLVEALEAIDVVTLNEPSSSQAYNLVFNCDGHNYTGNALTLIPNPSQTQGLYGLKYIAPANVNLAQAFYFVHTTGNKYKVYAVDTDGNDRYITTQAEGYGTTWYEGIRTITDASKAMEIEIRPNGEGLYLLWNTGANNALAHNGTSNNDMFTNNTANFQFVKTTKPSITINTTAAGLGTVMLPFAVASLPDGVRAFSCGELSGDVLTLVEVDALEANKPYLIYGSWNETLTGDAQGTALTYTEGLLTGVYTATDAPVGSYVLQKKDEVAFYKVAEDKQPTVGANRCYLTAPAAEGGARALFLDFGGETTGVDTIKALTSGKTTIYNAAGAVVPSLQKGLNIIKMSDGSIRKVMVK